MKYTHIDKDGMQWRFDGGRPISKLADEVMAPAWPTLIGRLNQALTSRKRAVQQLKDSGVQITPLAERVLKRNK